MNLNSFRSWPCWCVPHRLTAKSYVSSSHRRKYISDSFFRQWNCRMRTKWWKFDMEIVSHTFLSLFSVHYGRLGCVQFMHIEHMWWSQITNLLGSVLLGLAWLGIDSQQLTIIFVCNIASSQVFLLPSCENDEEKVSQNLWGLVVVVEKRNSFCRHLRVCGNCSVVTTAASYFRSFPNWKNDKKHSNRNR